MKNKPSFLQFIEPNQTMFYMALLSPRALFVTWCLSLLIIFFSLILLLPEYGTTLSHIQTHPLSQIYVQWLKEGSEREIKWVLKHPWVSL